MTVSEILRLRLKKSKSLKLLAGVTEVIQAFLEVEFRGLSDPFKGT